MWSDDFINVIIYREYWRYCYLSLSNTWLWLLVVFYAVYRDGNLRELLSNIFLSLNVVADRLENSKICSMITMHELFHPPHELHLNIKLKHTPLNYPNSRVTIVHLILGNRGWCAGTAGDLNICLIFIVPSLIDSGDGANVIICI